MRTISRVGAVTLVICLCSLLAGTARADIPAYRAAVQETPGLVDHYTLDADLTDVFDGGNGFNDGVAAAGQEPTFTDGVNGDTDAAVFDGLDDRFTIARSIQDDFTVVGWIQSSEVQVNVGAQYYHGSGVVYSDVPGGANDFGVSVNGTRLSIGIGNPDQTVQSVTEVTGPQSCGWSHFAAVRRVDAGGSVLEIYINGELDATRAATNTASLTANASITIGGNAIDNRFFNGALDEVSLFSVALDAAAIGELFDAAEYTPETGECPPEPDARCDTLDAVGPEGEDRTGVWTLTASASDDSGDPLTYLFRATHEDGTMIVVGPQEFNTVELTIDRPGMWTFSVEVDDSACCPDSPDAVCTTSVDVAGFGRTDFQGRIVGEAFLIAGPFAQPFGCNPSPNSLLANFIAPDRIDCAYPGPGDELDYDPALAASTGYFGPEADGVPTWRPFDDGSPQDGDQDLAADVGGSITGNAVSWLVTYVEYSGAGPVDIDVCLGSDDSGQVWIDDRLVISESICRGRGDCDTRGQVTLDPGVHRIAAAAWQGVGGWGLRLTLVDPFEGPILDDDQLFPDWIFHGTTRPGDFPPCEVLAPVTITTCGRDELGDIEVAWENEALAEEISITVDGEVVDVLSGDATEALIAAADIPFAEERLTVCVENGATPPACCVIGPAPALVNHWDFDGTLEDQIGDNDGLYVGFAAEPVFVEGFDGEPEGAVLFNGVDEHVQVTRSIQDEFTVSLWIRTDVTQVNVGGQFFQGSGLVYADVPGVNDDFGVSVNGDFLGFGIGRPDQTVQSTTPVTDGEWNLVTTVRDIDDAGGVSVLRVYVNGVLEGTIDAHPNVSSLDAAANITIGSNVVDSRFYTGAVDDLRLFNYPLSDEEVAALFSGEPDTTLFLRGDTTQDGVLNITDAVKIFGILFLGDPDIACQEAKDVNNDGDINITDGIRILGFLFLGQPAPEAPGHESCGADPDDPGSAADLGCESHPPCEA